MDRLKEGPPTDTLVASCFFWADIDRMEFLWSRSPPSKHFILFDNKYYLCYKVIILIRDIPRGSAPRTPLRNGLENR